MKWVVTQDIQIILYGMDNNITPYVIILYIYIRIYIYYNNNIHRF